VALPDCHSRRELATTPGVLYCVHPRVHVEGQRVRAEICKICDYCKQPPPQEFRPFPPPPPRGRCAFLGDVLGFRDCSGCGGKVRIKVLACSHPAHGKTTWEECLRCRDHQKMAAPVEAETS
jgi:hypothetical protein